jgi:transcriptional regulator with XRE-family HTH domain
VPVNGHRRTPGLRREEVSQLAGVGLSWYTWLEQGRDITPSSSVLDALARVLNLDAHHRNAPLLGRDRQQALKPAVSCQAEPTCRR